MAAIAELCGDRTQSSSHIENIPPCCAGLILSVEPNQNVESKMENVESKIQKCGVHENDKIFIK